MRTYPGDKAVFTPPETLSPVHVSLHTETRFRTCGCDSSDEAMNALVSMEEYEPTSLGMKAELGLRVNLSTPGES